MKKLNQSSFNFLSKLVLCLLLSASFDFGAGTALAARIEKESSKGNETWPFRMIGADRVHQLPNGQGEGVKICLMSTGVDTSWQILEGVIAEGRNFVPGQNPEDFSDYSHKYGSMLAAVIAGQRRENFVGIAPKAKVVVAKMIDKDGSVEIGTILEAFDYCVQKTAVIYLGFGGGNENNISMDALFASATLNGKTLIAAGGNGGASLSWPARHEQVKAVGVVNHDRKVTSYSPRDPRISFVAPGHQIPIWIGPGKYQLVTGSGFSAAMVIGVEALRRSTGSPILRGADLGLPVELQGLGLIDAGATVLGY